MTVTTIPTAAAPASSGVAEPDWPTLFPAPAESARAADAWRVVREEMEAAGTLSPACAEAIRRYVVAAVMYDRALVEVVVHGPVVPREGDRLPAWNLWQSVLNDNSGTMATLEAELGLTPRRRGAVTAAKRRKTGAPIAAEKFIGAAKRS